MGNIGIEDKCQRPPPSCSRCI